MRAPPKRTRLLGWMRAASSRVNWLIGTRFPEAFPFIFVVGYPKSGTTWAGQLVADYFQIPYPRHNAFPIVCAAVVHGHEGVRSSFRKTIYVVRDPRDVMVSLYFHHTRFVPAGDRPMVPRHLRRLFPRMMNKRTFEETSGRLSPGR